MVRAGNIAGAAGAGAGAGRGLHHGADHLGVLAHAEIVVGAPDDDVAFALRGVPYRMGKPPGQPFEIGKHAVTPFIVQLSKRAGKKRFVVHRFDSPRAPRGLFGSILLDLFLEWFQAVCRGDKYGSGHAPPLPQVKGATLASSEATCFERSAILPTIRHDMAQLRSGVSHPSRHCVPREPEKPD